MKDADTKKNVKTVTERHALLTLKESLTIVVGCMH